MRVKTSELSGAALDFAVAKAEGFVPFTDGISWIIDDAGRYKQVPKYSTDWAQGGPIIEREKIGVWWATHYVDDEGQEYGNHWYAEAAEGLVGCGETPLIAAMRCFVASKLGEEVEVPDGL